MHIEIERYNVGLTFTRLNKIEDGLLVVQNGASEIIPHPHRVELVAVSSGGR
jgi:hypothetical protein